MIRTAYGDIHESELPVVVSGINNAQYFFIFAIFIILLLIVWVHMKGNGKDKKINMHITENTSFGHRINGCKGQKIYITSTSSEAPDVNMIEVEAQGGPFDNRYIKVYPRITTDRSASEYNIVADLSKDMNITNITPYFSKDAQPASLTKMRILIKDSRGNLTYVGPLGI